MLRKYGSDSCRSTYATSPRIKDKEGAWRARIEGLLGELEDVGPDPLPPSGGRQQQQPQQQHYLGVRQQQGGERGAVGVKGSLVIMGGGGALRRHVPGEPRPRP